MDKPNIKHLTIHSEVLFNHSLTWPQKVLLSYFWSLKSSNKEVFVNNAFLSRLANLTPRNVQLNLAELESKNYIVRKQKGRHRIIEVSCLKHDPSDVVTHDPTITLEGRSYDHPNTILGSPKDDPAITLTRSYDHPDIKDNNKINNKCYVVPEKRHIGGYKEVADKRQNSEQHIQKILSKLKGFEQPKTDTQEQQTILKNNFEEFNELNPPTINYLEPAVDETDWDTENEYFSS